MEISKETFLIYASPVHWFQISEELFQCTETLYKDSDKTILCIRNEKGEIKYKPTISRGFILLAGYTIENLLKALLIIEKPELIETGKIDNEITSGHNLYLLIEKIDSISFDSNEIKLIKTFSEAIPYWGRYPVPKKWQDLSLEKFVDKKMYDSFKELYHKLRENIYLKTRLGWVGPNGKKHGEWYCSDYDPDLSLEECMENEEDWLLIRKQKIEQRYITLNNL
jgi:hypothetical protein